MPEQRKLNELPIPLPPHADYNKQSVPLPGTERPGQTGEPPVLRVVIWQCFDGCMRRAKPSIAMVSSRVVFNFIRVLTTRNDE